VSFAAITLCVASERLFIAAYASIVDLNTVLIFGAEHKL
jgi:hypothetical protein